MNLRAITITGAASVAAWQMSKPWVLRLELTRRDVDDIHSALRDAADWNRQQAPNMGPSKEARYLRDAKRYEELAMMLFERMTQ